MSEEIARNNFIRQIIDQDLETGKLAERSALITRFPPEPNGYLHIGHAKSICLNFGLAQDYLGQCNLRFDDTNPSKEEQEFVDAIEADVKWLGFKWANKHYASDYFERYFDAAIVLINKGLAYVDDSSPEEIREMRGTFAKAGVDSPYRGRSVEENLSLFQKMRAGEFQEGQKVLRAKIDMSSPNMNLRDPALYRIRHVEHHQTGNKWCIYPMYDFAHALGDAFEGITHSICTLEFEDHRPLYDWYILHCETEYKPQQYEFSRLNLQYAITSKRKLTQLVHDKHVTGWDDPRMPTIAGLRRRGCPPQALHLFCERIGITKSDNSVEMELLEQCMRDVLDPTASRAMAVLNPLKITLTNYPEDKIEFLEMANHPKDEMLGKREVPFSRHLYIDQADFKIDADKKYKRLLLNDYVRLRGAYIIQAIDVLYDEQGQIKEVLANIVENSVGKNIEGIKARGVIQFVSQAHAVDAQLNIYERLFTEPHPDRLEGEIADYINSRSLSIVAAKVEPSLLQAKAAQVFQFEREAYFVIDAKASTESLVFNRVVTLKDNFSK